MSPTSLGSTPWLGSQTGDWHTHRHIGKKEEGGNLRYPLVEFPNIDWTRHKPRPNMGSSSTFSTPTRKRSAAEVAGSPGSQIDDILNGITKTCSKIPKKKLQLADHTDNSESMMYNSGITFSVAHKPKWVPVKVGGATKHFRKCCAPECGRDERCFVNTGDGDLVCQCGIVQNMRSIASNDEERRTFADDDCDHKRTEKVVGVGSTSVGDARLSMAQQISVGGKFAECQDAILDRVRMLGMAEVPDENKSILKSRVGELAGLMENIRKFTESLMTPNTQDIYHISMNYSYKLFASCIIHDVKCTCGANCAFRLKMPKKRIVLAAAVVNCALDSCNHPSKMILDDLKSHICSHCEVDPADAGKPLNQSVLAVKNAVKLPHSCANDYDPSTVVLNDSQDEPTAEIAGGIGNFELIAERLDLPIAVGFRAQEIATDWIEHCGASILPQSLMATATVIASKEVIQGTARVVAAGQIKSAGDFVTGVPADYRQAADAVGMHHDTIKKHVLGMALPTVRKTLTWIFKQLEHVGIPDSVQKNAYLKADIWRCLSPTTMSLYEWTRRYHASVIGVIALFRAFEACSIDRTPFDPAIQEAVAKLEHVQAASVFDKLPGAIEGYNVAKQRK